MKSRITFARFGAVITILLLMSLLAPEKSTATWVHFLEYDLADSDWTLVGEDNGDWAGYFASPAGDVNGDGLGDALIGAAMAGEKVCPYPLNPDGSCPGLPKGPGVAYLVLGRAGGLPAEPLNLEFADASFEGCEVNSMTARQLFTAGDVNGDGYDDILISGWKCGENYIGKAYLFLGRPDVESWGRFFPVEQADASFLGENEWDFLSYYLAEAGDVNDDGYDDFLITATHHEYDEPCPPGTPEDCVNCCRSFTASAELFILESDTWTNTVDLNVERMDHTAVKLDNKVLVAGGQNIESYLNSAELYDPTAGVWEFTGNLIAARSGHTMEELPNGKVMVAGGRNDSGVLASVEIYDPGSGIWSSTGSMNTARVAHTSIILENGKVLVVGGKNDSSVLNSTELYDPETGNWTNTGTMNVPRFNHTVTILPDGKVLVSGGENNGGFLNSTEIYNPATGMWTSSGDLNVARSNHTATLIPGYDSIIVAGGRNDSGYIYEAELFGLNSGTWVISGSLVQARTNHTATLLPDGRVMLAGGQNDGGSVISYEYYDPATATWTIGTTRSMNVERADHTAVLMDDGTLLVAGGRECSDFGKVYLFLGKPEIDWGSDFDVSLSDASFIGEDVGDRIGRSANGVGDVNGDGFDDFLIGAKSSDYGGVDAGQNYLFLGRPTEGDPRYDPARPWWGNDYPVAIADASFVGEAPGDETGRRVAKAGDVNGDGLDDMLMQAALNDYTAPDAGITYLVLGRQAADWGMRYPLSQADASFVGENKRDQSGRRMSGAGDVNHDGYADFLTGAPHNEDGSLYDGIIAGKSYLIFGRPEADWGLYYPLARADVIHIGKPEIGVAGYDNAELGDFDGDGIDDYLIAAYGGRNNQHTPGEVYIISGSETPIPTQFFTDINRALEDVTIRFVEEYWEPNGWDDMLLAELYLEEKDGGGTGFLVSYNRSVNGLYLFDYSTYQWIGPCTPGENGQLDNGVVLVDCKGSGVIVDELHAMRVLLRIRWLTAPDTEVEAYRVGLRAVDLSGNDTQFIDFGSWPKKITGIFLPMVTK